MPPILRNILAVVLGFVIGSVVNGTLVNVGGMVVPMPEGVDVTTVEGLRAGMNLLGPLNFLFPFLAHALGTLAGAFVAAKLAAIHKLKFALGIGVLFLLGGITMVALVGGPLWFIAADLVLAYLPMGYLGWLLAEGRQPKLA